MTLLIEATDRFQPADVTVDTVSDNPYRPTGLVLPEGLTFEQWTKVCATLGTMEQGINWWIGDALNYGEANYGDKYTQAILETGRDRQSLADLAWVARSIEISRRRENLTWSHHREVAPLDPEMADRLLDIAEREKLSIRGIRDAVQSARRELSPATQQMALGASPENDTISSSVNGDGPAPPSKSTPSTRRERPEPEPAPEADFDPVAALEETVRENESLRAEIESLSASDLGSEVRKWSAKYAQLDGRLQAEITKANEAVRIAKRQGELLGKLRTALGVETNGEILGAVQDLLK